MKRCLCNRKFRYALLLLCAFLTGCSHLTSEIGPPLPAAPGITVGRTTSQEVLEKVGVPSEVSASPSGFVFLYEHNYVAENQLGFTLNVTVMKWFKFVYARSRLTHDAWLLCFDTNQVLQAWGKEDWKAPLGQGAAAQFLMTAHTLVDSSPVRQPATQHEWGAMWLDPLPQVLNSAQSLQDGRFGLEQTLAPTAVGQHTLEMIQPPPPGQKAKQSQ
jgi:hypothetical protein